MSDADAALASMIAKVQGWGRDCTKDAAREAAPLVEAEVKRTAAANTDPYGAPLPPKRDGTKALPNAVKGVSVTAGGPVIRIKVSGAYAIHFFKKVEQRRLIPTAAQGMPPGIVAALTEGARRAFAKAMGS